MNLQMFKLDLEEGRGTSNQIANIHWIIEKARESQKKHLFLLCTSEAWLGDFEHYFTSV